MENNIEQLRKTYHEEFVDFVGEKTVRDVNLIHCMKRATGLNVLSADFDVADGTMCLKRIRFTDLDSAYTDE